MISYSQNCEDVMLWRALKHVENGFYIDVGANDPTVDSVTKTFYEQGWHGINIEPLPMHHADLVRERPRDINLKCAAGAANGEIELWECDIRGWATATADVIAYHTANGHTGIFHKVPVVQLSEVFAQHVSGEVHFLKIDVEGFEKAVIDGIDLSRFRPWIMVIEATRPNSTEEVYGEWETSVLSSGYVLAYMDGLNRFYVADDHPELLDALRYPPNPFDGFIRSEQLNSELRAQQAESRAQEALDKAEQYNAQLLAVYASTHWRISKPLRWTMDYIRGSRRLYLQDRVKQLSKMLLLRSIRFVSEHPPLKRAVITSSSRLGASGRLRRMYWASQAPVGYHQGLRAIPQDLKQLTPRARLIYVDLKSVIQAHQKGQS